MVPRRKVAGEQNPEMAQMILADLIESKAIMDIDFLENWLVEKERLSVETYFEVCTETILIVL